MNLKDVSGTGSGALLLIGRDGTGEVTVNSGGAATIDDLGGATTTQGGMILGGSGSAVTNNGDGTLTVNSGGAVVLKSGYTQVGRSATGLMQINAGGLVDGSLQITAVVGRKVDGNGTVNVDGAGATWKAAQNLFIGSDASLSSGNFLLPVLSAGLGWDTLLFSSRSAAATRSACRWLKPRCRSQSRWPCSASASAPWW